MKEQRCFTQKLPQHLKKLKKELKKLTYPTMFEQHVSDEQFLIDQIKSETGQKNRNNVTRTQAYLEFYQTFPEIHWALLGHMVSRNGAWNMTDLKGDLLSRVLSSQERKEGVFQVFRAKVIGLYFKMSFRKCYFIEKV
ncbi:DUF2515 family protein [Alkalihalobacillus sp. BA299]|uniref:DUF2515 family protein n=1 Tax=Alkalihalobacillus sp. BA299 TaxID=2815938 RepID=UPI001ADA1BA6|nr:DUF2515 family protein [Alkalihalobacillus sp. BA299]